jgi:hypothetical protein
MALLDFLKPKCGDCGKPFSAAELVTTPTGERFCLPCHAGVLAGIAARAEAEAQRLRDEELARERLLEKKRFGADPRLQASLPPSRPSWPEIARNRAAED